ncbi:MAG: adenylosuccinate synthase [Pelagibacterales bacterium]|nr:adenylosuccinate synthase [Pelagibacterales bacterium]
MKVDVLLGLQWGDEGKGKIVDVLTTNYDIIARFQGGPNAGHTLEFDGIKHVLHTIPSGIFHKGIINLIGNGVVIDPVIFENEIKSINKLNIEISELLISKKAHLILPTHKLLDAASEKAKGKNKIGSTLKGIGPTYMDKTGRNGLRVGDVNSSNFNEKYKKLKNKHIELLKFYDFEYNLEELESKWFKSLNTLKSFSHIDSEHYIHKALKSGKKILAEGAQGTLLDIDFGSYPFVTSSNTITAGACTGLGVAPNQITDVFGIFKAYCTRVGSGPFPTELNDEIGEHLGKVGNEFGATTGRARRCGWIDLPALKYAININGVTQLMMMKSDVLSGINKIKVCTHYLNSNNEKIDYLPFEDNESLIPVYDEIEGWEKDIMKINNLDEAPDQVHNYIKYLEDHLDVPIKIISVGPDRKQTFFR